VGKQHFTLLYSRARNAAFTESNIASAWDKVGLFPFNPDRVLNTIVGPAATNTPTESTTARVGLSSPNSLLYTPVTSEGFSALRHLIEGESQGLSELDNHRIQNALNAAERAIADRGLLLDENRLLFEQNCEKQTRASTMSRAVGTAKVMSYQEIEEARRKHDKAVVNVGTQSKTVGKRRAQSSPQVSVKRVRLTELEQAIRENESSKMRDYCHVFEC
jgi:hypothetical protein